MLETFQWRKEGEGRKGRTAPGGHQGEGGKRAAEMAVRWAMIREHQAYHNFLGGRGTAKLQSALGADNSRYSSWILSNVEWLNTGWSSVKRYYRVFFRYLKTYLFA